MCYERVNNSLNEHQYLSQLFFNFSPAILNLGRNFYSRHHHMWSTFYCGWSCLPVVLNYVMLRIWGPGSLMSQAHTSATLIDLCIIFQSKLNISCIMSCGNTDMNLYLGWSIIIALLYIRVAARWKKNVNYNCCIMETGNKGDIVYLHSEATARNMQPWGAGQCINLNNKTI